MKASPDDVHQRTLEAFMLRARRVEAHSLAGNKSALLSLAQGTQTVEMLPSGESFLVERFPPEEQVESLMARVRPMLLVKDATHYARVLRALGYFGRSDAHAKAMVRSLRGDWKRVDIEHPDQLGSFVQIQDAEGNTTAYRGSRDLADGWLYGDLVHHNLAALEAVEGFDLQERFRAGARLTAYVAMMTLSTLGGLRRMISSGLVKLDPSSAEQPVHVPETEFRREVRAYFAPVGTEIPPEIGSEWTQLTFDCRANILGGEL